MREPARQALDPDEFDDLQVGALEPTTPNNPPKTQAKRSFGEYYPKAGVQSRDVT